MKYSTGLCLMVCLLFVMPAFCQVNTILPADSNATASTTDSSQDITLADYLPPLQVLIDSAIANSPEVNIAEYQVVSKEYDVQKLRNDWSQWVSVGGQYRYGALGRSTTNQDALLFPELTVGYFISASVRIPLDYFITHGDEVKSAESQVNVLQEQKRAKKITVREEVIDIYNHLLLLQKLIKIANENRESSELIYQMAEDRFRDGETTLEELSNSTNMRASSASQYETLKSEFSETYGKLERLVGVPLNKLKDQN